ncbi:nudix hydrolase 2-like [Malania oleifera]|uniref:nudix hydrolase 2-like n=1 Tax=Malania oleifera TaxID=397392 RepID=UPI0025ADBBBF|nr:nudix hydrolase 2-like [Malania oleifera]
MSANRMIAAGNESEVHGGLMLEMKEPMDSEVFVDFLRFSILDCRRQGRKGVWLKLPIELVNLLEAAVKEGFWYHNAEPKYLMLVYWVHEGLSTVPANATHKVVIAAFVMNEKREVLVVQEKIGKFKGTGVWKFPTGGVDEGEDICEAAVREVKEETNIDTEFVEVLAFRESHKSFFGKSELYILCMLQPISFDIQKQELELDAAQWMPFEEYAAQPFVQKHELYKYGVVICAAKIDSKYCGFPSVHTESSSPGDRKSYLYMNTKV